MCVPASVCVGQLCGRGKGREEKEGHEKERHEYEGTTNK